MRLTTFCAIAALLAPVAGAVAQQPFTLTRGQVIAAALARGPRLNLASADTAVAAAQLLSARGIPNPLLSASYTKSLPQFHVTADMPLDFLWLRNTRIRSADAARLAAQYRYAFDRARVILEADTSYTRALAALAHVRLSQRNADAADSVRRIAVARRDAGDASDLDVELATISAGQGANSAAADSLTLTTALLNLQALIGLPTDRVVASPVDSLVAPATAEPGVTDTTLAVASAVASLRSATLAATVQHRSALGFPGIMFGFETGDPTGAEPGILPTFGITLPLPFFNRNRGPIAEADAARLRANAELGVVRIDAQLQVSRAQSTQAGALARVARDRALVGSADRVAAMSLTAYREGAAPLSTVLEAQRTAREILAQYIDDVASASIAAATLRVLTLTPSSVPTP